jgi:hypothetical protein
LAGFLLHPVTAMFIEFDTAAGPTMLNVRHIVLVKRSSNDVAEIIFANDGSATVTAPYQEACDSIQRLLEHVDK